jgi:hypothetical protein
VHAEPPVDVRTEPIGHDKHDTVPLMAVKVPAAHAVQIVREPVVA